MTLPLIEHEASRTIVLSGLRQQKRALLPLRSACAPASKTDASMTHDSLSPCRTRTRAPMRGDLSRSRSSRKVAMLGFPFLVVSRCFR